jgi:hypothetical protein
MRRRADYENDMIIGNPQNIKEVLSHSSIKILTSINRPKIQLVFSGAIMTGFAPCL